MKTELRWLRGRQLSSGQFSTTVRYDPTGLERPVSTLCPTYLVTLMLTRFRERHRSDQLIDTIIERGLDYIESRVYRDPVEGWLVWRFNVFYPPDWEETCWSSLLLYEAGRLTKKDLEPNCRLLVANEFEDKGVGVWLKDPYTPGNEEHNAFDPIVSLSVSEWLRRVFNEGSNPTERYLQAAIASDEPSLFYNSSFQQFFYWMMGKRDKAPQLVHDRFGVFHHARRGQLVYASKEVWRIAEFLTNHR